MSGQNAQPKEKHNIIDLASFREQAASYRLPKLQNLSEHLTLRNIVIGLGAASFLIFIGSVVSARIAFLSAALLGLSALVLFEMSSRRKWENEILRQMQRMNNDHDRIVREVARNRNDMVDLKKNLSDAGAVARSYSKADAAKDGEAIEQRMIKAIAEKLSRLSEPVADEFAAEDLLPDMPSEAPENQLRAIKVQTAEESVSARDASRDLGRQLSDEQVLQLVNLAVRQNRIDLFLQPIVALPQRKLRFYEMFSRIRIRPDVYLQAERYIEVAMKQDLVPVIDNLLLLRGLQAIRDAGDDNISNAYFCNITALTLNDSKFMGDLVEFIAQYRTLAPRIVFELGQKDLATMSPDMLPVLSGLATLGCRFSMDRVRSLSFDVEHLNARHVRFIKVDAAIILSEIREQGGLARMKRLKSELDRQGIDLIVEKVETERQLIELLDTEIDYGQGYLLGHPAAYQAV